MPAALIFACLVLGSAVLIGLPGLRYEVPLAGESGPIERDLRYYPPNQHATSTRSDSSGWRINPEVMQILDPAQGQSTMRWKQPSSSSLGKVRALAWVESGSEWVDIDPIHIAVQSNDDPFTGFDRNLEIDLVHVPGYLNTDIFVIMIDWFPVPTGGLWRDSEITTTYVRIMESPLDADFNRDGVLCIADLNAYMDAFLVHAPRADLNRDGAVDAEDLRIYLATFEANYRP